MTAWLEIATVLILVIALASGRVPVGAAFFAFVLVVPVAGFLPFRDVLTLLADPTLVAVISLVLFASVVTRMSWLGGMLFGRQRASLRGTLARFLSVAGAVSAVMPNTAVVGAFVGPASRHPSISAHQLLLPLSYIALAGGMVTQFGTSANLIVVGQAEKYGIDLGIGDFVLPGFAALVSVVIAMVVFAPMVLRETKGAVATSNELFHVEAKVLAGSNLVGKSLIENSMRNLDHFYIAEIIRSGKVVLPVAPTEILQADDVLIFVGDVRHLDELSAFSGLDIATTATGRGLSNIYHAVVSSQSILVGSTLKQIGFRALFDGSVFAIRRGSERLSGKLGGIELMAGDLLVIAAGPEFHAREDVRPNLYIVETDAPGRPTLKPRDALLVSLIFAAFVVVAIFETIPFALATLLLIVAAMGMRWLTVRDLRRIFPFELAVTLWGSLVLGALIAKSGIDDILATWLIAAAGSNSAVIAIVLVFIFTWLLTELLSNTSAAVAAFPVAMEVASRIGAEPAVFAVVVAFGASASFLVPFGYQTHLMVLSPGRYRFLDFIKLGAITLIAYGAAALTVIALSRL